MQEVANFKKITSDILSNIEALKVNLEAIATSDNFQGILDELNELDERRVTLLEPMLLRVRLQEALDLCNDISLIDHCNRHDPERKKVTAYGESWLTTNQAEGRVTIPGIKRIRECLNPALVSIQDGKRIAELIQEGKIK